MSVSAPAVFQNPINRKFLRTIEIATLLGLAVALILSLAFQNLAPLIFVGLMFLAAYIMKLKQEYYDTPRVIVIGSDGVTFYYKKKNRIMTFGWNQIRYLEIMDERHDVGALIGWSPGDKWTNITRQVGEEMMRRYVLAMGNEPPTMKEYNSSKGLFRSG